MFYPESLSKQFPAMAFMKTTYFLAHKKSRIAAVADEFSLHVPVANLKEYPNQNHHPLPVSKENSDAQIVGPEFSVGDEIAPGSALERQDHENIEISRDAISSPPAKNLPDFSVADEIPLNEIVDEDAKYDGVYEKPGAQIHNGTGEIEKNGTVRAGVYQIYITGDALEM